jgi:spore germination cell wall hydrolase CwlJ-like protein
VTPQSWALVGLTALVLAPYGAQASVAVEVPVIRVDEVATFDEPRLVTFSISAPEPPPPAEPRAISFSVPPYELTTAERELVATCLILEAASQGDFGMRGVMAVVRNRARGLPELFAPTVLRPKQFSAFNQATSGREPLARLIARAKRDRMWPTALTIVDDALRVDWHDPTGGATHYTRTGERTAWTRSLANTVTIGAHAFYR